MVADYRMLLDNVKILVGVTNSPSLIGLWEKEMPKLELVEHQAVIGLNQDALDEWIAYRKEDLKKPMTPRAIKMVQKKLLQYPEDEQQRLVEHAIEMNWQGIYYVEPPRQATTRQTRLIDDLTDTSWAN